jgi:hypothetical protein
MSYSLHGPIFLAAHGMENNLILSVQSLGEVWEVPDDLVLNLEEYKTEHPIAPDHSNANEIYEAWFKTLSPDKQQKINRKQADQPST